MPKPKGGRGHAAPYDTKLIRIPVPLADQVQQLVERYQDYLSAGGEAFAPPRLLDAIASDNAINKFEYPEHAPQWRINDLCACLLPANGVVVPEVKIKSFDAKTQTCKVYEESTDSHWSAAFEHLIPIPVYKLLEKSIKAVNEFDKVQQSLKQLEDQLNNQEIEINDLHQKNGDLNLEVEILRQQLKDAANPVNEFELKDDSASAEYWEATAKDIGKQTEKLANKLLVSKEIQNPTQGIDDKAVNNLREPDNKVVNSLQPLSQRQLGKRLGVSHTAVGKQQKLLTTFTDWSKQRDPEGIAWEYDGALKLFRPSSKA